MSLIVLGFFIILLITFTLVAMGTRPTKDEKAFEQRLAEIGRNDGYEPSQTTAAARLMKTGKEAPWVVNLIERYEVARRIQQLLVQSASTWTIQRLVLTTIALAGVALLFAYLMHLWLVAQLAFAFCAGVLPLLWLRLQRHLRLKAFNNELANAVDMMARALRAGHSVVGSIEILADQTTEPAKTEFREVFRQQNFGLPLRDALMQMLERVPSDDLRVVVTAILVQKETGGNLGEILDRVVFVIRERVRIRGEIKVQTAQGRLTGWILTLLPVILMFVINFLNPGYSNILFDDPFGRKLIYVGLIFLTIGALLIRKMINSIEV